MIRLGDVDESFDPTTITDHAPILTGKTTLTMDENETTVATLVGTDADGDSLTYSITGGADQDLFTIDASTGVLTFKTGPDYEDPLDDGGDNLYDVEITVSDGTNSNSQALMISVLDLNEKLKLTNKIINENEAGATVGDLSINDDDFGNDNITYELSGEDAEYFILDGTTIKLKSGVSADFETKSKYTLTVKATNASGDTITEKVVVKIANVNEAPILTSSLANQSNDEDSAFSFIIPSNTFNDEDGDTLTYIATLEDGSALPSWLTLDAATGTFSGTPLNDDVGTISVTVTATDGSFSVTDTFNLTVVNTNDDPTALTLSSDAINENADGAVVGSLTTDDVDVGDTHTYTLSGDDADSFEVVNGQLKLKAGVSADYESKSTYAVTVTTTDGSGSTFAQSFNVAITDVNDAPTAISLSASSIDENTAGVVVGTLTTSDQDDGDTFTYEISGPYASYFEIKNGILRLKENQSVNYELTNSLLISVKAIDSGGLITTHIFNISVNNKDDAPTNIALSANSITSGESGVVIGELIVSDDDDDAGFTFSVNDNRFEIVDGLLKLKDDQSINGALGSSINLSITVTDSQGLQYTQNDIKISFGSITLDNYDVNENESGIAIGQIEVNGIEASNQFSYEISGEDARFFEITSDGKLKLASDYQADYENKNTYTINLSATNEDGDSIASILEININDIDEVATARVLSGKNAGYGYSGHLIVTVPEKGSGEEVYLFTIEIDDPEGANGFDLLVKLGDQNVSEYFRFDASTGAVYLKAGFEVDFETTEYIFDYFNHPTIHAGTNLSAEQWLSLYITDGEAEIPVIASFGGTNNFLLAPGDSASDGEIEINMGLQNGVISYPFDQTWEPPFESYEMLITGGKDITGDGLDDAVVMIHDYSDDNIYIYLVPGSSRSTYDDPDDLYSYQLGNGVGLLLTSFSSYYYQDGQYISQTPSDINLGDINGDGFADIILGFGFSEFQNIEWDYNDTLDSTSGFVSVIHGADLETLSQRTFTGQTWSEFLSPLGGSEANFGYSVSVGDVNGDGIDDLIIGAPYADENGLADIDEGAIFIIYGQSDLKTQNWFTGDGEGAYGPDDYGNNIDYLAQYSGIDQGLIGSDVVTGDFNGDGLMDFVVADEEAGIEYYQSGVVFMILGSRFGEPQTSVLIDGPYENAELGRSWANLGDVNGDGNDDLGITDQDGNYVIIWGKNNWGTNYDSDGDFVNDVFLISLWDVSFLDGNYATFTTGIYLNDFIGVGDVNGDGYDDFFMTNDGYWESQVSGSNHNGIGLLVYGQASWPGEVTDIYSLNSVIVYGSGLQQVSPLGDFDGDGLDEFMFTADKDFFQLDQNYLQEIVVWWGSDRADESTPDVKLNISTNNVTENETGSEIGKFNTVGLESDDSVDYINLVISGTSSELFEITSDGTLKLKDDQSLNYESGSEINLYINGYTSNGLEVSAVVSIGVVDVNEGPDFIVSNSSVNSGEIGVEIGDIIITDQDSLDSHEIEITGEDASYFEITSEGKLKLKDGIEANFDDKTDYILTMTISDSAGFSVSKNIVVSVNVSPDDLSLSNSIIDESHRGIEIGKMIVSDQNVIDSYSYQILGPDADMVEITSDGTLKLKDNLYADYEIKPTIEITVIAIDQGGLKVEKDFTININDLEYATPYASDITSQANVTESTSYFINAMLFGLRLDVDGDNSTQNTITYSVITIESTFSEDYRGNGSFYGDPHLDIADPSQAFFDAVDRAFALISSMTGINFVRIIETETQVGDIRIGLTDSESADYAGVSMVDIYGINDSYNDSGDSDIWMLNYSGNTDGDWADGTFGFQTLLHEIGHSLGLKHPHNFFSNNSSGFTSPLMPDFYDAQYYTMMAYRDYVGDNLMPIHQTAEGDQLIHVCGVCGQIHGDGSVIPSLTHPLKKSGDDNRTNQIKLQNLISMQNFEFNAEENLSEIIKQTWMETNDGEQIYPYTPMFFDILALRYLYSYNQNSNTWFRPDATIGDDLYLINGPVNFTIFDTGGIDTIDFSSMDLDSEINLNNILSFIGTDKISYDNGEFFTGYVISIYWFNEMENVKSGSGSDTITCNISINQINCGPGDDTVLGISSGDSVYGDDGEDTFVIEKDDFELISGGSGDDRINISALLQETFSFNLTNLKGELESIENVIFSGDDMTSIIEVNVDAIKAFNSGITNDQDSDGDPDTAIYLLGDTADSLDLISTSAEDGWVYLKSSSAFDYYQSGDGETYFITIKDSPVYEDIKSVSSSISNQSIRENVLNGVIGLLSFVNLNQLSEGGNIIQFSLSGEDADKFEIIDGNTLKLKTGILADYENQSTYNISINLTFQSGSETKTIGVPKDFVIAVTDSDENQISGTGSINQDSFEVITGTAIDDHFDNVGGYDNIDGKAGIDTVYIFPSGYDKSSDYEVITLAGVTQVKGSYDVMTLINVENLVFSDKTISLDTTLNDASYFIGTAYNTDSDRTNGTTGNDVYSHKWVYGNTCFFDGKNGDDTALIFKNEEQLKIITLSGITKITDFNYLAGTILTLKDVEILMLINGTITLDATLDDANYIFGGKTGTSGNDVFDSWGGTIDGRDGDDTLLIFADRNDFEITLNGDIVTIEWITGPDTYYRLGKVELKNFETIKFADETVQVSDLTSKTSDTGRAIDESIDDDSSMTDDSNGDYDSITLPSDDQSVNDFDLSKIVLPIIAEENQSKVPDPLDSLHDLIQIENSILIDFDFLSGGDASVEVKHKKMIHEPDHTTQEIAPWDNVTDDTILEGWTSELI
ncbi:putative Ig domain-containing protein [Gammaproteobacteria bacterium]|nr:putative Ig domain-containing protein [Gammaproteobacteria bacterium]